MSGSDREWRDGNDPMLSGKISVKFSVKSKFNKVTLCVVSRALRLASRSKDPRKLRSGRRH